MADSQKNILSLRELRAAFPQSAVLSFEAGEELIAENTTAYSLFFILQGQVQVYRKLRNGGKLQLARLDKGNIIGEVALLTKGRRSANVRSETPVKLIEIKTGDFQKLMQSKHPLANKIALHLSTLLADRMTNLLDLFVQEAEKRPLNSKNPLEVPQVLRSLYSNFAV
jgi:CRP/FNR family transcriptional regulator, cyclic AMP receptor protein